MICLNHGFIHQTWHFQASGSFQKSTVTCLLALKIFKESRQSQRCFKQWLLCSNTCIVKVTILHENIYLAILVYLWKTRTKTKKKKKKAKLLYSQRYLGQWQIPQLWPNGHFPWNLILSLSQFLRCLLFFHTLERAFLRRPQHQCSHGRREGSLRESVTQPPLSLKQVS